MGLADLLLRKHTAIAKVVVPSGMAFGFFYTLNHGTNALTDAKNAALGEQSFTDLAGTALASVPDPPVPKMLVYMQPAGTPSAPVAYSFKKSSFGAGNSSS